MKSEEATESADLLGVFEGVFNGTRATFAGGGISVWDYSDPTHFRSLWESLEGDEIKAAGRVLIIWRKTPIDESLLPVNTVGHVSPLHWGACAVGQFPNVQVCILDLNPAAHRGQYLYEHYLSCDKGRLPWLRVIQAAHLFGVETADGGFQPDATAAGIEAVRNRLFPKLESKRISIEARHFLDRVRSELTSPQNAENRHAISNIIGPMILQSGQLARADGAKAIFIKNGKQVEFPSVVQSEVNHRQAFNSILQATGLGCVSHASDVNEAQTTKESAGWPAMNDLCREAGLNPAALRITLVDDQWNHGWYEWLKPFVPNNATFAVCADPDHLVQKLEDLRGRTSNLRFTFTPSISREPHDGECLDILLIDLRLFSGNLARESDFYARLLPLCRKFLVSERDSVVASGTSAGPENSSQIESPAWLGFSAAELASVDKWIKSEDGRTEANHHVCLTLLPRLLALFDMSLPVVIFSSTGQRSIVEKFKPYGNIITDFEKPRVFGQDARNVVAETHAKFASAIERAVRIAAARSACSRLSLSRRVTPTIIASRKAKVAHIFIDESGNLETSEYFSIGAFIVMADSPESLNQFSTELEKTHRWGFSCSNYVPSRREDWEVNKRRCIDSVLRQIPADYLPKNKPDSWSWNQYREQMNDVLGDINSRLTSSGFQWAAAAFQYKIDDKNTYNSGTGGLESILDHDMLFRKGLRDLLRFVIADYPVVGHFLQRPDTVFSVDIASRELRANKFSEAQYRDDMEKRFAARFRETYRKTYDGYDEYALMTLNGYDAFPLVASLFTDLGIPLSRLTKARAVILHDFQSVSQSPARMRVEELLPLQLHYLADWLGKCANWRDHERPKRIKSWFERGFIQERTSNFDELWKVVTSARKGLVVEAVEKARHAQLAREADLAEGVSAERYLRETASGWPKMLKGGEFNTLAGNL